MSQTSVDFEGVDPSKLDDSSLLSALLVTVANAVSLNSVGQPVIVRSPIGLAAALVGEGGHVVLHTRPPLGVCVLDLIAPHPVAGSSSRAVEILERRLGAHRASIETRERGAS